MNKKKVFIETSLKVLGFLFIWLVLVVLLDFPIKNLALWRFQAELLPLLSVILVSYIFFRIENNNISISYSKKVKKNIKEGLVLGLFWILVPAIILFLTRDFTIIEHNKVDYLGVWILSAFINVLMQELLIRGYIYELLKHNYNSKLAVLITTIIFTLFHGGAIEAGPIAIINVISMNLFINAFYEYQGNIIGPILAHGVWNIAGSIFLNVVSLADDYPSLLLVKSSENILLSGGPYKIEASILVSFINVFLLLYYYKKAENNK